MATKSYPLPELFAWVIVLSFPFFITPPPENHFTWCIFSNMDWWCPGCGLGESIVWLYRGQIRASLLTHPLGFIAVAVLVARVYALIRIYKQNLRTNKLPTV